MSAGSYISGIGHVGLLTWLVLGWGLSSEPLDFEVADVSVISGEQFAAMTQGLEPDAPLIETPSLETPDPVEQPPAPVVETPPEPVEQPAPVAPPPAPEQELTPPEPAPQPVEQVQETAPPTPPAPDVPVYVPPTPDLTASLRPRARPAPRVAPEAVAPSEPDVQIADIDQTATSPDAVTPDVAEENNEATAQEEASTEVLNDDSEPASASLAPQSSPRPPRAARPEPATDVASDVSDDPADDVADAIANAVAEANSNPVANAGQDGPPLTGTELEGFKVAAQRCWAIDSGSPASQVVVVVGFSLDINGMVSGPMRLISSQGGDQSAVTTAFTRAKRAIISCQRDGYQLPPEKYEQWRDVEMIFNGPEAVQRL
ncbi:hypothetical protein [Aestuariibius sp. HNIBRBA575]|uniref:hypothetical protein n=1 Tax=Aestuariibius sp. HNIBRBA575 TaxID=3233343 RepID=UPI0034A50B3D